MATLVDMFNDLLSVLPNENNLCHVHYVDLRNQLSNDLRKKKYKRDWSDEFHLTQRGFSKVAVKLSDAIDNL